jgi:hypothetical protein
MLDQRARNVLLWKTWINSERLESGSNFVLIEYLESLNPHSYLRNYGRFRIEQQSTCWKPRSERDGKSLIRSDTLASRPRYA